MASLPLLRERMTSSITPSSIRGCRPGGVFMRARLPARRCPTARIGYIWAHEQGFSERHRLLGRREGQQKHMGSRGACPHGGRLGMANPDYTGTRGIHCRARQPVSLPRTPPASRHPSIEADPKVACACLMKPGQVMVLESGGWSHHSFFFDDIFFFFYAVYSLGPILSAPARRRRLGHRRCRSRGPAAGG